MLNANQTSSLGLIQPKHILLDANQTNRLTKSYGHGHIIFSVFLASSYLNGEFSTAKNWRSGGF